MWATPAARAAMITQGKGEGLTGVRKTTMSHTPKGGYAQLERSEITEAHQGCKRYRPGGGKKKNDHGDRRFSTQGRGSKPKLNN